MKKIGLFFAFMMFVATNIYSQSKSEQAVASAVTALHSNVVNPERIALDMLVSDALSYGHSAGKVRLRTRSSLLTFYLTVHLNLLRSVPPIKQFRSVEKMLL